jgi:serine/threonine protein kinase
MASGPVPAPPGTLPLDGYALVEQVGSGGMGTVWLGLHRDSGVRVAVKVLTAFAAKRERLLSAFRTEIRACAGLHHPSIVRVLDRGEVTVEHEQASDGKLRPGSPYLVMEYVAGGSLAPWCGRLVWSEIRSILLGLLDGLAHAHARGLIHRDIKPANVLLTADRSEVRLTDFGLVHAIERATPGNRDRGLAGTPRYMAPEQVQGLWRDYGPWTDFYALGGLAYALASGYPPFMACRTRDELAHAHQNVAPPPLRPVTAVPSGFEDWLQTMLAKHPRERFQRASEAARALRELRDPGEVSLDLEATADDTQDDVATDPAIRAVPALSLAADPGFSTLQAGAEDWKSSELPAVPDGAESTAALPPMPLRWEPDEATTEGGLDATTLVGTGLGLYWLRSIPLIGRGDARDGLWATLGRVRARRRAEAVVIHGPSGVGKSRLAEWLALRAHEVAGADILKATHSPNNSPGSGIVSMLGRYLRVLGLSADQVAKRLLPLLREQGVIEFDEAMALAELLRPRGAVAGGAEETGKVRFGTQWEALRVAQRALERAAVDRPVVVWFDDAHWGLDALLLVQQMLREQERQGRPSSSRSTASWTSTASSTTPASRGSSEASGTWR